MLPAASGWSPSATKTVQRTAAGPDTEDDQSCLRYDRGVPRTARNAALLGAVRRRLLSAGGCPLFPRTPVLLRTLSPSSLLPLLLSLSLSLSPSLSLLESPAPSGHHLVIALSSSIAQLPSCQAALRGRQLQGEQIKKSATNSLFTFFSSSLLPLSSLCPLPILFVNCSVAGRSSRVYQRTCLPFSSH